ncbi:MAG: tripartite tricarboxylate transporter TctB family protein [Planctomycetes bacterium]|nr:tripartite tricarboxylate transporter TctB family protein [Planctomycetota bacterium]
MKFWTIITLLCLAGFGLACTLDVRESAMAWGDDGLGVTGFPRLVGIALVVAATGVLIATVQQPDATTLKVKVDYRSFVALAVSMGYILGVCYLGFRLSTFGYLLILPPLFSRFRFGSSASVLWLVGYALGVTIVFHLFFGIFKVYLPPTVLW